MAYKVGSKINFETIEKASGFFITRTGSLSKDVGIGYLELMDGRDPANNDELIELNEGYSCVYLCTKGGVTFSFYGNQEVRRVTLSEEEYVYITPGTKYEINGNGKLLSVQLPAYSSEMFLHPKKQ